jgi:hypothetical protein
VAGIARHRAGQLAHAEAARRHQARQLGGELAHLRIPVAGKAVACLASCRHTGNVFRLRLGPGLTAGIGAGTDTEEKTIMGRAAAADGGSATPRGPFAVDQDRALAELELAWSEGGYHGFTAAGGTWCAITSASEVLTSTTPDELARAIRAHWQAMRR